MNVFMFSIGGLPGQFGSLQHCTGGTSNMAGVCTLVWIPWKRPLISVIQPVKFLHSILSYALLTFHRDRCLDHTHLDKR